MSIIRLWFQIYDYCVTEQQRCHTWTKRENYKQFRISAWNLRAKNIGRELKWWNGNFSLMRLIQRVFIFHRFSVVFRFKNYLYITHIDASPLSKFWKRINRARHSLVIRIDENKFAFFACFYHINYYHRFVYCKWWQPGCTLHVSYISHATATSHSCVMLNVIGALH